MTISRCPMLPSSPKVTISFDEVELNQCDVVVEGCEGAGSYGDESATDREPQRPISNHCQVQKAVREGKH